MMISLIELATAIIGLIGVLLSLKGNKTPTCTTTVHHIVTEEHIYVPQNNHQTGQPKNAQNETPPAVFILIIGIIIYLYVKYYTALVGAVAILSLIIAILYAFAFHYQQLDTKNMSKGALIVSAPALFTLTQLLDVYKRQGCYDNGCTVRRNLFCFLR